MKLCTQTGSLVNHIASRYKQETPEVGMGATILAWTDRYPATVIEVDGDIIKIQEDNYERVDNNGMSESQDYKFTPNPNGAIRIFKFKNDQWQPMQVNPVTGRLNKMNYGCVTIGHRSKYHAYSF